MTYSKTAREIVEEQMPNFKVVEPGRGIDAVRRADTDATTPDLAALRKKYLGENAGAVSHNSTDAADADGGEASGIVLVKPKAATAQDRGVGPKAVVVSRGRITGKQG